MRSTAADESELRVEDVLSVTSSDPAGSALLAHGVLLVNHVQPASIGISMLIMLTSKGGASADMRRCPLGALAS